MSVSFDDTVNLASERAYNTLFSNSTLLPLLLLSLARQKNSPDTSLKIKKSYDYIVVGAGASGSVVASRLSEISCVNVLLLEAGPPPPKLSDLTSIGQNFLFSDIDWQHKTSPQKYTGRGLVNRQLTWPAGKTLGGSTVINGALYVRGNKKDYDDWAAMGAKGWSYEEVLPYFKKLEQNKDPEYIANGYHGVKGPITVMRPRYNPEIREAVFLAAESTGYRIVDPNARTQTGFYDKQVNMRDGQRCSTAKAYLVPVEERKNLDIVANALVTKIIINRKRATGVHFDVGKRSFTVSAKREVIVSAGTVKTAQLLMLSGIGPKKELEKFHIHVHADLPVGHNFHDHPGSSVEFTLSRKIRRYADKLQDPKNIERYINERTGPLNSPSGVAVMAFLRNDEINPKKDSPNYELYFQETGYETIQRNRNLKPEVFQQVFSPYLNYSAMSCIAHALHPRSRGTVRLQSSNPYDPPIIDPNYLADPRDADDLVEGLKACKRIGTNHHMRKIGTRVFQTLYPGCEKYANDDDVYFRCQIESVLYTYYHPCGTTKMGHPKDPTTVVDPELRVKKIRGLRVVDNSIMPKITSGNTGVPAIMIGEKASDIIKSTIECGYQEGVGRQFLYPTPKFNASSNDYDYDQDEDEILLSPEVEDNYEDDYDYSNYADSHNNGQKKMIYPEEDYDHSNYPNKHNNGHKKVIYPEEDYDYSNYPDNHNNGHKIVIYPEDHDYANYPDNHNNGHKKMIYPENIRSDEIYLDDSGKRSFYRSRPNYKLCHGSPTCGYAEYVPPLTQNWGKYFGNDHWNKEKIASRPWNWEFLRQTGSKRR